MPLKRLGLFDDHPIVLAGLADLIGKIGRYQVVCTGATAGEALRAAFDQELDLIVMDLQMPGEPLEVIKRITAENPIPLVLVFTASDTPKDCAAALAAGASGYVVKGSSNGDLFHAIDAVIAGQEYVPPTLAARMLRELRNQHSAAAETRVELSHREDQIVHHLLQGASNRDIAGCLQLSEKTVKHYMTQIMQKFDARNRVEVVLAAQKQMKRT